MSDVTLTSISDNFLKQIKRESITPNRQKSSGVIDNNNSSGIIFDNGNPKILTNTLNQTKGSAESQTQTDICFEKKLITNRINIETDDIFVNGCRLNPALYSMASFSQNDICTQGDLNMYGTVLVKAYDKSLKKTVYIRRKIRMPIMHTTSATATIDPQFSIDMEDMI